jgi:hypothetical protein
VLNLLKWINLSIKISAIVFFSVFGFLSFAQKADFIESDSRLDSLLTLHKKINQIDTLVPGYRVQIFFESGNYSKDKALETAEVFAENFPNIRYYLSFKEPYYRLRVGDFRTLIEAKGFLNQIIQIYPSAFEVKDNIYFPLEIE